MSIREHPQVRSFFKRYRVHPSFHTLCDTIDGIDENCTILPRAKAEFKLESIATLLDLIAQVEQSQDLKRAEHFHLQNLTE